MDSFSHERLGSSEIVTVDTVIGLWEQYAIREFMTINTVNSSFRRIHRSIFAVTPLANLLRRREYMHIHSMTVDAIWAYVFT